ncbi:AP2 domain transcription factor, putative [Hepatocystis sp. ex Piliocolobus tephrosceles]|nr:AP2 domain transcription factor, putative [Hepatocystis sp. ex Piliocolobus tephrosceles]VWU50335.1 AP2 domain transcription factor, putative [Hepatocystis sp. ex Piliocolobus tephrosceles]
MNTCTTFLSLKTTSYKIKLPILTSNRFIHISQLCKDRKSTNSLIKLNKNSSQICKQTNNNVVCNEKNTNSEHSKNNDFIQYVFKWGIGNRFRSDPENRFHPVHLKRSKEVTIRKNYFDSTCENIKYEELNEQWEVFWYENNKLNGKPFPIKKYGIDAAKKMAFDFFESLKKNDQVKPKPQYESGVEDVHYDTITNCWVAFYRENNIPLSRSFSVEYHGFETAKKLAIDRVHNAKRDKIKN